MPLQMSVGVRWPKLSLKMFTAYLSHRTLCIEHLHEMPADKLYRTSQSFVKKKAALTLLRLYRKHPDVIPASEWALRIVSIMDDQDLVSRYYSACRYYLQHLARELWYALQAWSWHWLRIISKHLQCATQRLWIDYIEYDLFFICRWCK